MVQCRTCLKIKEAKFVEMSEPVGDDMDFFDYFNECTQLDALPDDELPQMLCQSCSKDLIAAYHFLQSARRADQTLRAHLELDLNLKEWLGATHEDVDNDTDTTTDSMPLNDKITEYQFYSEEVAEHDIIKKQPNNIGNEEMNDDTDTTTDSMPVNDKITEYQFYSEEVAEHDIIKKQPNNIGNEEMNDDTDTTTDSMPVNDKITEYQFYSEEVAEHDIIKKQPNNIGNEEMNDDTDTTTDSMPLNDKIREYQFYSEEVAEHDIIKKQSSNNRNEEIEEDTDSTTVAESQLDSENNAEHNIKKQASHMMQSNVTLIERSSCDTPLSKDIKDECSKKKYESNYPCTVCKQIFMKQSSLRLHLRQSHQDRLICEQCPRKYEYPKDLEIHNKLVHSLSEQIECCYCPEPNLVHREQLAKHFRSKHLARYHKYFPVLRRKGIGLRTPYICEICRVYFPTASALFQHQQTHIDNKPFTCPYCPMKFRRTHSLRAHHKRKHEGMDFRNESENNLVCVYCSKTFKNNKTLTAHQEVHVPNRSRCICQICNKEMSAKYLKTHIRQFHTEPRLYTCDVCGNPFKGKAQLYNHKKLHMRREFECFLCDKQYTRQCDLKVHMRSHTGEMPYECHLCDKKFAIQGRLTYHLQVHAGWKRLCKVCGKEFTSSQALNDHMYIHNGLPYLCRECGFGCTFRTQFTRHMRHKHDITMSADELNEMFKVNTGRMPRLSGTTKLNFGK